MSTEHSVRGRQTVFFSIVLSLFALCAAPAALAQGKATTSANGGSIQSLVWLDTNRNAIRDKNEVGVAGVMVSLLNCDGGFVSSTLTDQVGAFSFGRVPEGCHRLRFSPMEGYRYSPANLGVDRGLDSNPDPATGLTESFNVDVNQSLNNLDAGLVQIAAPQIGDRVWEDSNANGVQDVGENGLSGVDIALLDCSGNPVTDSDGKGLMTRTNGSGYFVFDQLGAGCYSVQIAAPQGFAFSDADRTVDAFDSDVNPATGIAHAGAVASGQGAFEIDAGMYRNGSIGDWIWIDADADHTQSISEQGLGGVQVMLLDAGGVPTGRSQISGSDGYYEFTDVVPGAYRLQFALPNGYIFGEPEVSPDSQLDSNANGLGVTQVFQVASGGQRVDIDVAARLGGGIPSIDAEKLTNGFDADNAPGPYIEVGGDVLWEYVLTNTGSGDLFNLSVVDDQGVSVNCPQDNLAEGETITCTGSSNDAQAGQYMNEVYACGAAGSPDGGLRCDKDLSHYFGSAPGISIEKSTNGEDADVPPGPQIPAGGQVTWEYFVLNTGNVTLTDVVVLDSEGVAVVCPSMTLDPGVSMSCMGSGIAIEGQYANIGSVDGTPPVGDPVTDNDPSHYFGQSASIDIEKATNGEDADSPTGPSIVVGGDVNWTYVVTNTGSLTLTDIVVSDSDDGVHGELPGYDPRTGCVFHLYRKRHRNSRSVHERFGRSWPGR